MSHRVATRQIYRNGKIRLKRSLSLPGEILVRPGQTVSESDAIGQVTYPSSLVVVNVGEALGADKTDLGPYLLKTENDQLEVGEPIAEFRGRLPFSRRISRSPVKGRLVAIAGGWVLIEADVEVEVVKALVTGQIAQINRNQEVIIETIGTYIEAACGFGGEGYGRLHIVSDDPLANIEEDMIADINYRAILVAGGTVYPEVVRGIEESRVAGLIVGSIDAALLAMDPPSNIPIIATEGFGHRAMAPTTFSILQARAEATASIVAFMPTATRSDRPVMIVPDLTEEGTLEAAPTGYVIVGNRVRILREPEPMVWGHISALLDQPQMTEAGVAYSGAEISFSQGMQFVPWLNLEQIK